MISEKKTDHISNDSKRLNRRPPAFAGLHPAVTFAFFAFAVFFAFCFSAPAYLLLGFAFSSITYFICEGIEALKLVLGMLMLTVLLALISPFLNPSGDTVLFSYFDRPYTAQALAYGASIALMLSTVIIWFAVLNKAMTQDSITYLFGRVAPGLALVVVMTGRMMHRFGRRLSDMSRASKHLCGNSGLNMKNSPLSRIKESASVLPAFVLWAFDCGIVTSDSMLSRGFGLSEKTTFSVFRFGFRDALTMSGIVVCTVVLIIALFTGSGSATYLPSIDISPIDSWQIAALFVYVVFLCIPLLFEIWDMASWRFSMSKI